MKHLLLIALLLASQLHASDAPQRYDLAKRASEIDPRAKEHPEIKFAFIDDKGKPAELQHAVVDTRVPSQGRLVIWLMGHNQGLFERVASYGYHGIQPHYANGWFAGVTKEQYEDGTGLRWEKVILSGISHGSTTAARFAMHQKVDRVVMFSGPRDNTQTWQGEASATPSNRFFGFTHILDGGWVGDHYCRSWQLLKLHNHGSMVDVDNAKPPYGNTRRLITNSNVKNNSGRAHTVVVPGGKDVIGQWLYDDVVRYLFTHPVDPSGPAVPMDADCVMQAPN